MYFVVFQSLPRFRFSRDNMRRLSIENLPTQFWPALTSSRNSFQGLRNIHTLEVSINTFEQSPHSPAMSFYDQLPHFWLAPLAQSLRTLHLSANTPWGWYPKVDLRGVYFLYLEDLMLARFTFSHDWQLQWLSDHADSLKRLRLIECAILDHATSTRQYFCDEGYPLRRERRGTATRVRGFHSHEKRWSHYFKAIETCLPRLRSFSLLPVDHVIRCTNRQAVFDQEIAPIRNAHRYLKYRSISYSPLFGNGIEFTDVAQNKLLYRGKKERQGEEDEQALRELLFVIEQRNSVDA